MFKKVLLGLAALSCVSLATEGTNLYLKVGGDLYQKFDTVKIDDIKYNKKDGDDFGYEITAEFTREVYPNLELGLGISYQDHSDPKNGTYVDEDGYFLFDVPGFKSIPVYAIAKYNFPVEGNFKPYVKADLGYSFNRDNGNMNYSYYDDLDSADNEFGSDSIKINNGISPNLAAKARWRCRLGRCAPMCQRNKHFLC